MPKYSKNEVLQWLGRLAEGTLDLEENNMQLASDAIEYFAPAVASEPALPPGYLSPHFQLSEFTRSSTASARGIDNTPDNYELQNLTRLANTMEQIRSLLGDKPITITSAFRSEALNKAVQGVPNSAHRLGLAADFVCPAFGSPKSICQFLVGRMVSLGLDQLINEDTGGSQWVHVGLSEGAPRMQALTITDSGTVTGIA